MTGYTEIPLQSRHIAALCALYILDQGTLDLNATVDLLQYVEVRHTAAQHQRV